MEGSAPASYDGPRQGRTGLSPARSSSCSSLPSRPSVPALPKASPQAKPDTLTISFSSSHAMSPEILVLRIVHILGGIFWLGSGLFTTFFLVPALGRLGPMAAGPVMGALQQRRLFTVLPGVALLTMLSGARLLQIVSGGFTPAYFDSRTGGALLWSGVAAVSAFLLSMIIARPAAVRAGQLGASLATMPESERAARSVEVERLRRRSGVASIIAMTLLIGAAIGMAVARYLG